MLFFICILKDRRLQCNVWHSGYDPGERAVEMRAIWQPSLELLERSKHNIFVMNIYKNIKVADRAKNLVSLFLRKLLPSLLLLVLRRASF